MISRLCLSTVALAMLAAPALAAESKCMAPVEPVVPKDGKTASQDEMNQSRKDVVAFIKDSDQYQLCLKAAIDDADQQLKSIDPKHDKDNTQRKELIALRDDYTKKGDDNQKTKVRIGGAYNNAVKSFQASHKK